MKSLKDISFVEEQISTLSSRLKLLSESELESVRPSELNEILSRVIQISNGLSPKKSQSVLAALGEQLAIFEACINEMLAQKEITLEQTRTCHFV